MKLIYNIKFYYELCSENNIIPSAKQSITSTN